LLLFAANGALWMVAKEALVYGNGAFVYGKDVFIIGGRSRPLVPTPNRPAFITVSFANSGNTVARDVMIDINACAKPGELPGDFSYPSFNGTAKHRTRTLVPPKGEPQANVSISDEALGSVYGGERNLFVWGTVHYDDIFHAHHATEFCFRFNTFVLDDNGAFTKTVFGPCDNHNCDDDDCPNSWGNNSANCSPPSRSAN
jgi:hypothetical protein